MIDVCLQAAHDDNSEMAQSHAIPEQSLSASNEQTEAVCDFQATAETDSVGANLVYRGKFIMR